MKLQPYPSPNFDQRNGEIDMIIVHYTGMRTAHEAIERLCDPDAKVSAHYVIDENGDVHQLVVREADADGPVDHGHRRRDGPAAAYRRLDLARGLRAGGRRQSVADDRGLQRNHPGT